MFHVYNTAKGTKRRRDRWIVVRVYDSTLGGKLILKQAEPTVHYSLEGALGRAVELEAMEKNK
jgi:hypothetical protein